MKDNNDTITTPWVSDDQDLIPMEYEVAVTVYVKVYAVDAIDAQMEATHIVKQMVEMAPDFIPEHDEDEGTGVTVRGYPVAFRNGREVLYTRLDNEGHHEELGSSSNYLPDDSQDMDIDGTETFN
jgi:hypothetical protein